MRTTRLRRGRLEILEDRHLLTTFSTKPLMDFTPGPTSTEFADFQTIGDYLYFTANDELWRTDGTTEGTERTSEIPSDEGGGTVPNTDEPGNPPDHLLAKQLAEQKAADDGLPFGSIDQAYNFGDQAFMIEENSEDQPSALSGFDIRISRLGVSPGCGFRNRG